MSITLQSLVDRAVSAYAATGGSLPHADAQIKAEALAQHALYAAAREVVEAALQDPKPHGDTRRARGYGHVNETVTIALTNGAGTLPDKVLVEFMFLGVVSDPADATVARNMFWQPNWNEFIRPCENTLGYFTVRNRTRFEMTRPGASYTPGAGMTGNVELTTPCAPQVGAAADTAIDCAPEVEEKAVRKLALWLAGVGIEK